MCAQLGRPPLQALFAFASDTSVSGYDSCAARPFAACQAPVRPPTNCKPASALTQRRGARRSPTVRRTHLRVPSHSVRARNANAAHGRPAGLLEGQGSRWLSTPARAAAWRCGLTGAAPVVRLAQNTGFAAPWRRPSAGTTSARRRSASVAQQHMWLQPGSRAPLLVRRCGARQAVFGRRCPGQPRARTRAAHTQRPPAHSQPPPVDPQPLPAAPPTAALRMS